MKTILRIMTATLLLGLIACNSKPAPTPTKVATSTKTYQSSGK